jgi:hypothetical protein
MLGRFWHIMHDEGKVAWLMGYHDGLLEAALAASVFANPNTTVEEGIKLQARITQVNFPSGMTYPEIAKALDQFYDTPENLRIDLRDGLQIVLLRSAGMPPSTIEDTIAKYRKQATQR